MTMPKRAFALLSSLLIATMLVAQGCGFHLRGKVSVPTELLTLYIQGGEESFVHRLETALKFNDVFIVKEAKDAAILDLDAMTYERTVNTTDSQGRATGYKLAYKVKYTVIGVDGTDLNIDEIKDSRTLTFQVDQILQSENEEEFLKEDMEKELVNRLMRQISRIKIK